MTTPDPRLAALRALAEKATPGEWTTEWSSNANLRLRRVGILQSDLCIYPNVDCEFIAAANPQVVLALLVALSAAEGERDRAIRQIDEEQEQWGRLMQERDERERAARVCDKRVEEYDRAIPSAGPINADDFRKLRWEAEECARLIRSLLPDDNALGADDKGGKPA